MARYADHAYDDIIHLPHHVSETRPHMSLIDRAAQFSPFAALTGYEAVIAETARLTDQKIELDEKTKEEIDGRLQMLLDKIQEHPKVTVTFFKPDDRKSGGEYITLSGFVKRIDEYESVVIMANGDKIPMDTIYWMEGDVFQLLNTEGQ